MVGLGTILQSIARQVQLQSRIAAVADTSVAQACVTIKCRYGETSGMRPKYGSAFVVALSPLQSGCRQVPTELAITTAAHNVLGEAAGEPVYPCQIVVTVQNRTFCHQ